MITNIFFDFDGVLCESVEVKTEAFRQLYAAYGKEITDAVVAYHKSHGGISRFEKIRYYHTTLLHQPISEEEVQELASRFSELAVAGVLAAPEVTGTTAFLKEHIHQYKYWVITATPTEEIKDIITEKGWADLFAGVYGSPNKKNRWTKHIIDSKELSPSNVVFVGDALADKNAAEEAGITFILRRTEENKELFAGYNGLAIKDLTELQAVLNSL